MVEGMMAFFADAFQYIYKVRLMKLLWYADALAFSRRGYAISGLVYCHEQYGALPIGSRDLIYLSNVSVIEEEDDDKTRYRISCNDHNFEALDQDEITILQDVVNRFIGKTTEEIINTIKSFLTSKLKSDENDIIILFKKYIPTVDDKEKELGIIIHYLLSYISILQHFEIVWYINEVEKPTFTYNEHYPDKIDSLNTSIYIDYEKVFELVLNTAIEMKEKREEELIK